MNFLPIFKYRLKDDMRAVAVFLIVVVLCNVLIMAGIMVMTAEVNGQAYSNFSMAMMIFTFVLGIVTVREDLRLGIQNGVSRETSLAACFVGNIVAALASALGVTLVEWLSIYLRDATQIGFMSIFALIYGEDTSVLGQLRSFLLSFVWCGSAVFVGSFLSLLYWRLTKLWRWIVSLGMGAALLLLMNATLIVGGFMDAVLSFFRWLGEAPLNLSMFLVGVAVVFAVFDWLLTRKAPITAATA